LGHFRILVYDNCAGVHPSEQLFDVLDCVHQKKDLLLVSEKAVNADCDGGNSKNSEGNIMIILVKGKQGAMLEHSLFWIFFLYFFWISDSSVPFYAKRTTIISSCDFKN
jgi:hypothetical protein